MCVCAYVLFLCICYCVCIGGWCCSVNEYVIIILYPNILFSEDTEPINKLKEALSSKEAFQKYYLVKIIYFLIQLRKHLFIIWNVIPNIWFYAMLQELSELAMGTYKIIGRVRCAQQIGRHLADYYMYVIKTLIYCIHACLLHSALIISK